MRRVSVRWQSSHVSCITEAIGNRLRDLDIALPPLGQLVRLRQPLSPMNGAR